VSTTWPGATSPSAVQIFIIAAARPTRHCGSTVPAHQPLHPGLGQHTHRRLLHQGLQSAPHPACRGEPGPGTTGTPCYGSRELRSRRSADIPGYFPDYGKRGYRTRPKADRLASLVDRQEGLRLGLLRPPSLVDRRERIWHTIPGRFALIKQAVPMRTLHIIEVQQSHRAASTSYDRDRPVSAANNQH
jgi:hypothetical protein